LVSIALNEGDGVSDAVFLADFLSEGVGTVAQVGV
jgi:hypothetical protein